MLGAGRALPAAEACGRLSHDSLYAGTQESNRIPMGWDALGGGNTFSSRQAGGMFASLGPPLATPCCSSLYPSGRFLEDSAAITIRIASFPYLSWFNGQMVRGIVLQCDVSGGSGGDESATLCFQALFGEHLLACAAIRFQKQ